MPPKRSIQFDPEAAKQSAKRLKALSEAAKQVEDAAEKFISLLSPDQLLVEKFLSTATESIMELYLVGMLGLNGVHWLHFANRIVPNNYPTRLQMVTSILNYALPNGKKVWCYIKL